jgi:hypothetical protein
MVRKKTGHGPVTGGTSGSSSRGAIATRLLALTAFAAIALGSNAAMADSASTGVLAGRVFDNDGKQPLEGATVMVTSPALQDAQVVTTDKSGYYRLPNLPPGLYAIQFDREGYLPNAVGDVSLRSAATLRVDAPLSKGGVETVRVTSRPNVDVGSSTSGTTLTSEELRRVPLASPTGKGASARSFEAVAEVAPGARSDDFGTSINGASSPENNYSVDGLSVGNPAKGTIGTQLSSEFVDEVNVITGGYLPEHGRTTGGVISVTTKSGSNQFHGQVFSYFSPGGLEGARTPVIRAGQPVQFRSRLGYIGDIGFDLGGPIIKDRLWFYTGLDVAQTIYRADRGIYLSTDQVDSFGNPLFEPTPIYSQPYEASSRTLQGIAKLTWAINTENRLSLALYASPLTSGGGASFNPDTGAVTGGRYGIDPLTGGPQWETSGTPGTYAAVATQESSTPVDVNGKWTSEFLGKRLLLDVSGGMHYQADYTRAVDGSSAESGPEGLGRYHRVHWLRTTPGPHSITEFETVPADAAARCMQGGVNRCLVGDYFTGSPNFLQDAAYRRFHGGMVVSYLTSLLGHHLIKAGFDGEFNQFKNIKSDRVLSESEDGTRFDDEERFGALPSPDMPVFIEQLRKNTTSSVVGGFLQDSWFVQDKVTVNLGLRYDAQYFYDKGKTVLSLPNQWSPRIGLIYDPTQQGKAKLFANYARYYQSTPLDFADVALVGEPQLFAGHAAASCNPAIFKQQINECQSPAALTAGTVHEPVLPNKIYGVSGNTNAIDPSIEASSSDEISAGGEYELMADARIGLTLTRRWINRWIEDIVPNVDLPAFDGNPGFGLAANQPKAKRDYNAATLFLVKNFSRSWLAQASYTLASLRGNYAGFVAPEDGFLGPSLTAAYDNEYLMTNRDGALPGDIRHNIKAVGAKDWAILPTQHLGTGLVLKAQSGGPTNFLGSDPHSYPSEIYILPRGAGPRLPWQFGADVQLSYRIAMAGNTALAFTLDVFNVFNFQTKTAIDENYTNAGTYPVKDATHANLNDGTLKDTDGNALNDPMHNNRSYGNATSYQAPRIFRFGLRGQF